MVDCAQLVDRHVRLTLLLPLYQFLFFFIPLLESSGEPQKFKLHGDSSTVTLMLRLVYCCLDKLGIFCRNCIVYAGDLDIQVKVGLQAGQFHCSTLTLLHL